MFILIIFKLRWSGFFNFKCLFCLLGFLLLWLFTSLFGEPSLGVILLLLLLLIYITEFPFRPVLLINLLLSLEFLLAYLLILELPPLRLLLPPRLELIEWVVVLAAHVEHRDDHYEQDEPVEDHRTDPVVCVV
jgi:hypothetical protein